MYNILNFISFKFTTDVVIKVHKLKMLLYAKLNDYVLGRCSKLLISKNAKPDAIIYSHTILVNKAIAHSC